MNWQSKLTKGNSKNKNEFDEKKEKLEGFLQGKGWEDDFTSSYINHQLFLENPETGSPFEALPNERMPQNLIGAILQNSYLQKADFSGSDLTNADLRGAKLSGANFDETRLAKTKISVDEFNNLPKGTFKNVKRVMQIRLFDSEDVDKEISKKERNGIIAEKILLEREYVGNQAIDPGMDIKTKNHKHECHYQNQDDKSYQK